MKKFGNLLYTVISKTIIVLLLLFFSWQTSICLAENTVLYRENSTALKNVYHQWDNYDYKTSIYLHDAIEEAIKCVIEYSLYYHRDITDDNQTIVNADDNYKFIKGKISSYDNFTFAVVNHQTGRIVSNIEEINYKSSGLAIRSYFSDSGDHLIIIRDSHNPYYENGTITEYTEYVRELANTYDDNFDLYIYFGEGFSFDSCRDNYEKIHNSYLSRVKSGIFLSCVFIVIMGLLFLLLLLVTGKNEPGGKTYPGLSDRLPNDLKFLLYIVVLLSMGALYENSLYMAIRADSYDSWLTYSSNFYIVRSYVSVLVNVCIIMSAGCTVKRQYKLGTLITNTYIYKFFFERRDKK